MSYLTDPDFDDKSIPVVGHGNHKGKNVVVAGVPHCLDEKATSSAGGIPGNGENTANVGTLPLSDCIVCASNLCIVTVKETADSRVNAVNSIVSAG